MNGPQRLALCLESVKAEPFAGMLAPLGDALERMVSIQMTAFPDHWSDGDRRDMAERHLFSIDQSRGEG